MVKVSIDKDLTPKEYKDLTNPERVRGPRPTPPKPNLVARKRRAVKQARRRNR